jgi:hypothetical protein
MYGLPLICSFQEIFGKKIHTAAAARKAITSLKGEVDCNRRCFSLTMS